MQTHASSERWLQHMKAAMEAVNIPKDAQEKLGEFFSDTAFFLVNTDDEPSQQNQS